MQLEHSFTVPVGIDDAWQVLLDIERVAPCMPGAALETVEGDNFTGSVKVKLGPISLTYKGKASFIEKDEVAHRATIDAQGKDSRGGGTAGAKVTATLAAEGDATTRVDVITDLAITGKPAQFGRGVMVDVGNKLIGQFADCLASKLAGGDGTAGSAEAAVAAKTAAAAETPTEEPATAAPAKASANGAAPAKAAKAAATKAAPAKGAAQSTQPTQATQPTKTTAAPVAAPAMSTATADAEPKMAEPTLPALPTVRTIAAADVEPIDLMSSAGPAVAKRLIPVAAGLAVLIAVLFALRRRK